MAPPEEDVGPYTPRNPITSAYLVDPANGTLSSADSVTYSDGTITHGRFGILPPAPTVPLEYLALLGPASEAVAALSRSSGAVALYGASKPHGLAVVQLAAEAGRSVVSVVDGHHSGHDGMHDLLRSFAPWPSTVASEEYAYTKANFYEQCVTLPGNKVEMAIIVYNDMLGEASEAIEASRKDGKRAMAEALLKIPFNSKKAYTAAMAVAQCATKNDGEVVVLGGSIPGLVSVTPTAEDATVALDAMGIPLDGDEEDAILNFWVQRFNAADFETYADYAIHKAREPCPGPRQIVVTK